MRWGSVGCREGFCGNGCITLSSRYRSQLRGVGLLLSSFSSVYVNILTGGGVCLETQWQCALLHHCALHHCSQLKPFPREVTAQAFRHFAKLSCLWFVIATNLQMDCRDKGFVLFMCTLEPEVRVVAGWHFSWRWVGGCVW